MRETEKNLFFMHLNVFLFFFNSKHSPKCGLRERGIETSEGEKERQMRDRKRMDEGEIKR